MRRWLTPWLLALALLLAQAGMLTHASKHLLNADAGLPDHLCELCLAQVNLGSAATATPLPTPFSNAIFHWAPPAASRGLDHRSPLARARAPPAAI